MKNFVDMRLTKLDPPYVVPEFLPKNKGLDELFPCTKDVRTDGSSTSFRILS